MKINTTPFCTGTKPSQSTHSAQVFLPVHKVGVVMLEFRLEVIVGQTVTFQFGHLFLQVADLSDTSHR